MKIALLFTKYKKLTDTNMGINMFMRSKKNNFWKNYKKILYLDYDFCI